MDDQTPKGGLFPTPAHTGSRRGDDAVRQLAAADVIAHVATAPTNTIILARRSAADQARVLPRSPVGTAGPRPPHAQTAGTPNL